MDLTRRPPMSRVEAAAKTLKQALQAEVDRIHADDLIPPSSRHVVAQQLEHLAISVGYAPDQIKAHRRSRP